MNAEQLRDKLLELQNNPFGNKEDDITLIEKYKDQELQSQLKVIRDEMIRDVTTDVNHQFIGCLKIIDKYIK